MKSKKIAVVVACMDGIATEFTGIGTVVHNYFEAYKEIWAGHDHLPTLYAISPAIPPECPEYRKDVMERTTKIVHETGGKWIQIPHGFPPGTKLYEIMGAEKEPAQSERIELFSKGTAEAVAEIAKTHDWVIVLAHTYFFQVRRYEDVKNMTYVWICHHQGSLFDHGFERQKFRLKHENDFLQRIMSKQDYVGAVAPWGAESFIKDYGVDPKRILYIPNGIYQGSYKYQIPPGYPDAMLDKANVPKDKKIMFFFGRFSPQKGIDIILKGWHEALKTEPLVAKKLFLYMLAPTNINLLDYPNETMAENKELFDNYGNTVYVNRVFDSHLPISMLKDARTGAILLPSRFELISIAGLETALFRHSAAVWHSRIDSFKFFEELEKTAPVDTVEGMAKLFVEEARSNAAPKKIEYSTKLDKFNFPLIYQEGMKTMLADAGLEWGAPKSSAI